MKRKLDNYIGELETKLKRFRSLDTHDPRCGQTSREVNGRTSSSFTSETRLFASTQARSGQVGGRNGSALANGDGIKKRKKMGERERNIREERRGKE